MTRFILTRLRRTVEAVLRRNSLVRAEECFLTLSRGMHSIAERRCRLGRFRPRMKMVLPTFESVLCTVRPTDMPPVGIEVAGVRKDLEGHQQQPQQEESHDMSIALHVGASYHIVCLIR